LNRQPLSHILRLMARGFSYPDKENTSKAFFLAVRQVADSLGIAHDVSAPDQDELKEAYTLLFINEPSGRWAPPFSSVYIGGHGLLMAEGREQAKSFYEEVGLSPATSGEPEDYLPVELDFVAHLVDTESKGLLLRFLKEHLLKWFPCFHRRLKAIGPHPYYMLLADMTSRLLNLIHQEVIDETT